MNKILMRFFIVFFVVFASGCATKTVVKYETVTLPVHKVERADPLVLKPVTFEVIEYNENTSLMMQFRDYENLSYNFNQITAYIKNQIAIIEYYESMITKVESEEIKENSKNNSKQNN